MTWVHPYSRYTTQGWYFLKTLKMMEAGQKEVAQAEDAGMHRQSYLQNTAGLSSLEVEGVTL